MKITVGLTFPGALKDEAIICYICKRFNVELSILEASFSEYSGWAILNLEASEEELKKVFEYLAGKDINLQKIEPMKG